MDNNDTAIWGLYLESSMPKSHSNDRIWQRHNYEDVDHDLHIRANSVKEVISQFENFTRDEGIIFDGEDVETLHDRFNEYMDATMEDFIELEYSEEKLNRALRRPNSPSLEVFKEVFDVTSEDGEVLTLDFRVYVKTKLWQEDTMGDFKPYTLKVNLNKTEEETEEERPTHNIKSGMKRKDRTIDPLDSYKG